MDVIVNYSKISSNAKTIWIPYQEEAGLIEKLLESEDLYPEEEKSFMKYIGESSVTDLVTNLKKVKQLLA
jgi:rRNA pseudouridine-1189 N-methylase Emg1 (Nep1/Mra1 family)